MKIEYLIPAVLLLFALYSCNHTQDTQTPQATAFHDDSVYFDTPFVQEYHEGYVIEEGNSKANDVRGVATDASGAVWAATANGVYRKPAGNRQWQLMIQGKDQGPAYDIAIEGETIWLATWNGMYTYVANELKHIGGITPPVAKIVIADEGIYALGPRGIWLYRNKQWEKQEYPIARSIRDAISDGAGSLWIGTDVGLYHIQHGKYILYQDTSALISCYVKGLAFSPSGHLWVGGLGGVSIRNETKRLGQKLPQNGLPHAEVNTVRQSPDGKMWVGTAYGISRFDEKSDEYSVRHSRRWLLSDDVRDIAFDAAGNAWIATAGGVSAIKRRTMTLAEKAEFFYDKLIRRHVREPWIVARFALSVPGDTTTIEPDDDDNDGEYTSMYLVMESLRYAVTKDPVAKERAKKAFDFLHYLREVTETDGFFARTIIPAEWTDMHDPNRTYTPQEKADELVKNPRFKPVEQRWRKSKDGKWQWKGDTSSDEMCGHMFGYFFYYNLVADEGEKERIRNHVQQIMDHLINNDFNLVDIDGQPTRWGIWSPEQLNRDPEWGPERALNSLEILSFLKFTHHITGNKKYQQAYLHLIEKEGYLENAKTLHNTNPAWNTYFDIYLAAYIYPALILYEQDPALKQAYVDHLDAWFAKNKKVKSPMVNFLYNYLTDTHDELANSVFFLKDAPLDLVDWRIDNGKREDLNVVRRPILEELQVDQLRPPSEYRTLRWDKNPWYAVAGNPYEEKDPVYWLLPYWLGRYLGLIIEDN